METSRQFCSWYKFRRYKSSISQMILKVITAQNKYTAIFIEIEKAKTVEDLETEWNKSRGSLV